MLMSSSVIRGCMTKRRSKYRVFIFRHQPRLLPPQSYPDDRANVTQFLPVWFAVRLTLVIPLVTQTEDSRDPNAAGHIGTVSPP